MSKLAILGGKKVREKGLYRWPHIEDNDRQTLKEVYERLKKGEDPGQAERFAKRFAQDNNAKHAVLTANGTVSLEMILRALSIGRGDEVLLPAFTFVATVSAIVYAGATPVFCDIEPDTHNLSADLARQKITARTRAIIPVHIGGRPADLDALQALCAEKGLCLICDAAQAAGSRWRGKGVGGYGIASSFSFQNSKNLTCGEGGAITTNSDALYEALTAILNGGADRAGSISRIGLDDGMTQWQAGILNAQFDRLSDQVDVRCANAAYLDELLAPLPFAQPLKIDERITKNSYHFYTIRLDERALGISRDAFVSAVCAEGVPLFAGYMPLYGFPSLKSAAVERMIGTKMDLSPLENTERVCLHECAWLYSVDPILLLGREDMRDVAAAMEKVYEHADELKTGEGAK